MEIFIPHLTALADVLGKKLPSFSYSFASSFPREEERVTWLRKLVRLVYTSWCLFTGQVNALKVIAHKPSYFLELIFFFSVLEPCIPCKKCVCVCVCVCVYPCKTTSALSRFEVVNATCNTLHEKPVIIPILFLCLEGLLLLFSHSVVPSFLSCEL